MFDILAPARSSRDYTGSFCLVSVAMVNSCANAVGSRNRSYKDRERLKVKPNLKF